MLRHPRDEGQHRSIQASIEPDAGDPTKFTICGYPKQRKGRRLPARQHRLTFQATPRSKFSVTGYSVAVPLGVGTSGDACRVQPARCRRRVTRIGRVDGDVVARNRGCLHTT